MHIIGRFVTIAVLTLIAACEDQAPSLPPQETGQDIVDDCIASRCTILDLDSRHLDDYGQLAALDHVEVLMISYTDFSDLSALAPLRQLRELHIGATDVTNLSGLAAFPQLEVLHVQDLQAQDYSAIRQLRQLQELAIGFAPLTSLDLVQDLPALRRLSAPGTDVTDLNGLEGHPALEVIDLSLTFDLDFAPLLTLPRLKEATLEYYGPEPAGSELNRDTIRALEERGVIIGAPTIPVC